MTNRKRLIWQLYPSYLLIVLLVLLATGWYASRSTRLFFTSQVRSDLLHQTNLLIDRFAPLIAAGDLAGVEKLTKDVGNRIPPRVTVILPDGTVIGDSEKDIALMENHAMRPEVQAALQDQQGTALRYSDTLDQRMLYMARTIREGDRTLGVLRISIATRAIDRQMRSLQMQIALGGLIIAVLAALVCLFISRRISRPLETMRKSAERFAAGDLTHRVNPPSTLELASLADALNQMARDLEQRINAVVQQRNESRAVLSSMMEGVVALDPAEHILHVNQAAARLFKQTADQMRGRALQEIVRSRDLHAIVRTTLSDGTFNEGDVVLYHPGEQILNLRCTPLLDAAGKRIGALLVLNDVTKLRRLENMRRDFAANVSHEMKTPLTAILGYVETLHQGAVQDPGEARRFLGIIHKHVQRLTAIIEDLMKLSRLEQDEEALRLRMKPMQLKQVIETAVQLCGPKARDKSIDLSVECDEHLTASLDTELMEQAVVNLLDNAIKYSPERSRVEIRALQAGGEIQIQVRDEGFGIAKKHLPRLFERFYRVDTARSRTMGGTGLGLAIVKHIVQAHGGFASVESVQGQGSTFTLHLPVAEP